MTAADWRDIALYAFAMTGAGCAGIGFAWILNSWWERGKRMDEPKTNNRKMSLWCYPMRHEIKTGEQYVIRADGSQSCVEHRDVPCPLVQPAGALR